MAGLAVLGTAIFLIAKGKSNKVQKEVGDIADAARRKLHLSNFNSKYKGKKFTVKRGPKLANQAQDAVQNSAETLAQQVTRANAEAAQKAAQKAERRAAFEVQRTLEDARIVTERTNAAAEAIEQGTRYSQARAAARINTTHKQKKMIQQRLTVIHSDKVKVEQALEKKSVIANQQIVQSGKKAKVVGQRANTVQSLEDAAALRKTNERIQQQSQNALNEKTALLKDKIDAGTLTRRERQSLTRANNRAIEVAHQTQNNAQKIDAKSNELIEQARKHKENVQKYMERTTPEQRAIQEAQNAEAQVRKSNRKFGRKLDQPKYKRAMTDLSRKENATLEGIVNGKGNYDDVQRAIALEILGQRGVV